MAVIVARGNRLAGELFEKARYCWVICASSNDEAGPGISAGCWLEDDDDPESFAWRFFVRKEVWAEGKFDDELREIANDAPHYVVWFDPVTGRVFAPYDGGFDLFVASPEEADDLKKRYADWLSDREDGL